VVIVEQRRRLALLALVACADERGIARDRLMAYLSPESPTQSARHALHQLLYYLRQQTREELFLGPDPLRLNARILTTDIQEFEQALAEGDLSRAVGLYRGPFLDGFHLPESLEFAEWAAQERSRLAALHADALRGLATRAHSVGEYAGAVEWWRQLVRVEPLSGRTAAGYMTSLAAAGDVPGALQYVALHEARLREELASNLDPDVAALAIRLREGGKTRPVEHSWTPTGAVPPGPSMAGGSTSVPSHRSSSRKFLLGAGIGALLILAMAGVLTPRNPPAQTATELTAVLPFRVSTGDSSVAWLGEGMVELLVLRLAGEGGMPMVPPGVSLAGWRGMLTADSEGPAADAIDDLASRLNVRSIVGGSVSGIGDRIALTAWLHQVPGGKILAQATAEGPRDSLPALVDQVAAQLLGQTAGVTRDRMSSLTSASLPALRTFLAARSALRGGRGEEAARRFREAAMLDSTFALASLELIWVSNWVPDVGSLARSYRLAHQGRDRLSPGDQALLDVMTNRFQTAPDLFDKWNTVVRAYPDRPESWYGLGDSYFHWGPLAGIDRSFELAEDAFLRGWQLDSATSTGLSSAPAAVVAEPILHLVELAQIRGDTSRVRLLVKQVLESNGTGDLVPVFQWHLALVDGDSARGAFWRQMAARGGKISKKVLTFIQSSGVGAADWDSATLMHLRQLRLQDPQTASMVSRWYSRNRGHPAEDPNRPHVPGQPIPEGLRYVILNALFWDGDERLAEAAVPALERAIEGPEPQGSAAWSQIADICAVGFWQAAHRDPTWAGRAAQRLRGVQDPVGLTGPALGSFQRYARLCATVLEAWSATGLHRPDAGAQLALADSLARDLIFSVCCGESVNGTNLVLARLWEERGDFSRALKAVRRRSGGFGLGPQYLSTYLREEGRLAALTGDTASAIRAYRHYLAFRSDPEPGLRAQVDTVRAALSLLEGNRN
jgi:DNA-binding SARP family transcriptional activator/tetratricopeptide (TPR) repeat protein